MSKEIESYNPTDEVEISQPRRQSLAATDKGRWERLWPVIACGAGLFSDGYLNGVRDAFLQIIFSVQKATLLTMTCNFRSSVQLTQCSAKYTETHIRTLQRRKT
jgi:hypothetical protein